MSATEHGINPRRVITRNEIAQGQSLSSDVIRAEQYAAEERAARLKQQALARKWSRKPKRRLSAGRLTRQAEK